MLNPVLCKTFNKRKYVLEMLRPAGPIVGYGLRKLKTGMTKALRIRDDTALDETDIGFSGNALNTGAITTWLARNTITSVPLGVDGNSDGVSDSWSLIKDTGITASSSVSSGEQVISLTASTQAGDAYVRYILNCVAGNKLTVSCTARIASAVNTCRVRIRIDWYNGASYLSSTTTTVGVSTSTSTSNATITTNEVTAPATTTRAYIRIGINAVTIGDTGIGYFSNAVATISNSSAYVTKWYDQSGNGLDAVQATTTNQPRIVNAGVLDVTASGKPKIVFNGTTHHMTIADNSKLGITSAPLGVAATVRVNSAATGYIFDRNIDAALNNQYSLIYDSTGFIGTYLEGNTIRGQSAVGAIATGTLYNAGFVWDGSNVKVLINKVQSGSTGSFSGSLTNRSVTVIGARGDTAGGKAVYFNGDICELILANISTDAQLQKIQANQGTYYGI